MYIVSHGCLFRYAMLASIFPTKHAPVADLAPARVMRQHLFFSHESCFALAQSSLEVQPT